MKPPDEEGKSQRSGLMKRCWWKIIAVMIVIFGLVSISRQTKNLDGSDSSSYTSKFKDEKVQVQASCEPAPARNPPKSPEGVCSFFKPGATASSIWHARISDILDASIHPLDVTGTHRGWTEKLLKYYLTPKLLQKSYQAPFATKAMKNVMQKVHRKLLNSSEPPVEIALFGGSVPQGRGCESFSKEMAAFVGFDKKQDGIQGGQCSYPYRLQLLLDHFLGKGVVVVTNLASGGTATSTSSAIIDYHLYPNPNSNLFKYGPDIVINAYMVNDNFPPWNSSKNITGDWGTQNRYIQVAQSFLNSIRMSSPCKDPPLVVFFDDYVGNQIDVILGEYRVHEAMEQLSFYENVAFVSYADAVRRFIWANTDETVFSADKWRKVVEVHFGMTAHVAAAWTLAYSMLQGTLDYCEDAAWDYPTTTKKTSSVMRVPQLVERDERPPLLHTELSTYSSQLTQLAKAADEKKATFCQSDSAFERPCAFAFIAGPMGTVKNGAQLNDYLRPFTVTGGWSGRDDISTGWGNKAGLQPTKGVGSSHILRLQVPKAGIQVVRINWMRSYGEKWDGSKARFTVSILHNGTTHYETQWELEGFHDQKSSLQYSFVHDLGDNRATVGSHLIFNMTLVVSNLRIHLWRFRGDS